MADAAFNEFVAQLAARTPAPSGGAAAARAAAMGTALCGMALRFAVGRPANAGRVNELEAAIAALDGVLERIQPLDERDMAA